MAALGLLAVTFHAGAQTLRNTTWKALIPGPPDSVSLHIGNDSSFAAIGEEVMVKSICHISKDTLTLEDYDGPHMCPNTKGVYQFTLKDDTMVLKLLQDDCSGRGDAINGVVWRKVM
jgi:hypothetical protein